MSKKLVGLICFIVVLCMPGYVGADNNTWTNDTGSGLWNDPNNWNLGYVPVYGETGGDDVQFITKSPGPVVRSAGMGADTIRMKDGNSALTIDGGELVVGSGSLLGNTRKRTATVTVNSGTLEFVDSASLPRWGTGILNMNGGDFIAAELKVGTNSYGKKGYINLYGGVIAVTSKFVLGNNLCKMDVTEGTLIVTGDVVNKLQGYIDNGRIMSYGGKGKLYMDYGITNVEKTTLTGRHFLKPKPTDGSTVSTDVNKLEWKLPEPSQPGDVISCVVYFGTDSMVENNPKVVDRQGVESVSIAIEEEGTYYWALDLYDSGISETEPFMLCPIFSFTAVSNFPPVVNAGGDIVSWLAEGPRVIELNGTAVDEDGMIEPLAVLWTVTAEPNELNPAEISDCSVLNPRVTVKEPGTYKLQLEAYDGEYTVSDTVKILVYADSCEHAQNQTGFKWLAADINRDCRVDFVDVANLAVSWLDEYYSTE